MLATNEDILVIQEELNKQIMRGVFLNKEVIIFGCTMYARNIRDYLTAENIEVTAFIDNNDTKVGSFCMELPVYAPKEYLIPFKDNILVIVCSKYYYEMISQVKCMGYEDYHILNILIQECRHEILDSEKDLEDHFKMVMKGYYLYRNLKTEKFSKRRFLLCPYQGTGDVYLACLFLPEFLKKQRIEDYALLVIGNNCRKVAELFAIENIITIKKEESEILLKSWEFLGSEKMDLYPLLYWGWRTKRYLYADKFPQITFTEMFRYDVFGFEDDVPMTLPVKRKSTYADALFKKMGLRKGKTIIIAPYAGSFVSDIPMSEWEKLVIELKKKDYDVCTNCYGDKEIPIKNTVPIQFPYSEVCNVLEYAGGFVAIRSGLCDIASSANCNMVVIYEGGFNASKYEYFSLVRMKLSDCINEFVYIDNLKNIIEIFNKSVD